MIRLAAFLQLGLLLGLLSCFMQYASAATYVYPRPEWSDPERDPYGAALLKLAFAKAGTCDKLVYTDEIMKQSRAVLELARGAGKLDIMLTMTSAEREAELLAIPIPLTKGVLGWRIALVRAANLDQFAKVGSAAQLKAFVAGQGHDWPDTAILRANGLPVHVSAAYDGMFKMLAAGRIDYFPRAIQQVFAEQDSYPTLAIDPHIVLRYTTDAYFFVNRRNTRLAADVTRGLEAAIADGSFDRLFYRYFAPQLAAAGLERRRIIDLPNPLAPASLPLKRKELWFSLADMRRPAFIEAAAGRANKAVTAPACPTGVAPKLH
jgi:hypothetical protein